MSRASRMKSGPLRTGKHSSLCSGVLNLFKTATHKMIKFVLLEHENNIKISSGEVFATLFWRSVNGSIFFSVTKLESKESLVTNGLDALEPGIHLDEVREMSAILDALTQKCDELTRRSKEITSLSHTNQRRLHMLSGRLASLRVVLERRRVTATPSRVVADGHPSDAYLSDDLPPGWERSFTDDDIPYYVNNLKEVWTFIFNTIEMNC